MFLVSKCFLFAVDTNHFVTKRQKGLAASFSAGNLGLEMLECDNV